MTITREPPVDVPDHGAGELARANVVLASLPAAVRDALVARSEPLLLRRGAVVHRQGAPLSRVFFPISGLVTGVHTSAQGTQFAYLHRGREGAIFSLAAVRLEEAAAECTLVVDVPAVILAVPTPFFREMLYRSPELSRAVLAHAAYTLKWLERGASCPAHHAVLARTTTWLLLLRLYAGSDVINVTHGRIAEVLGVRRQSISEALGDMRARRLISLGRERIVLCEPERLRQCACPCLAQLDEVTHLQRAGRFLFGA